MMYVMLCYVIQSSYAQIYCPYELSLNVDLMFIFSLFALTHMFPKSDFVRV